MRYRIGTTTDEIEVGQYLEINRGVLKAFFTLIIYPRGQKILNCQYMKSEKHIWFMFPYKSVEVEGKEHPDKIPYVCYLDKDYKHDLTVAVLQALKEYKPTEKRYAKAKAPNKTSSLSIDPSPDPDEIPF